MILYNDTFAPVPLKVPGQKKAAAPVVSARPRNEAMIKNFEARPPRPRPGPTRPRPEPTRPRPPILASRPNITNTK